MPRGVQRLDGVPRTVDDIAVGECRLRIKVDVGCVLSLELRVVLDLRLVRLVALAAGFTLIVGVVVVVLTLAEGRVGVGPNPSTGAPVASDSAAAAGSDRHGCG